MARNLVIARNALSSLNDAWQGSAKDAINVDSRKTKRLCQWECPRHNNQGDFTSLAKICEAGSG